MPKHILVVEHERHIARSIKVNLEHAGFSVIVIALNARDAWNYVRVQPPDLIYLDALPLRYYDLVLDDRWFWARKLSDGLPFH